MPKVLLIGDLHTKSSLLPFIDEAVKASQPDSIVLMGDYLDDWGIQGAANLEAFEEIVAWVRRQENAIMLMGNHDIAYYSRSGKCSGNNSLIRDDAYALLVENNDLLRVAVSEDTWLFTHAGLCLAWAREAIDTPKTPAEAAEALNMLLATEKGREKLEMVGPGRGGWNEPSPLWADWSELCSDCYPGFNQIVGHSPLMTCTHETIATGEHLWCCDTFSAGSRGFPHGDGSMLLLDTSTDEVSVIQQSNPMGFDVAFAKHYGYADLLSK